MYCKNCNTPIQRNNRQIYCTACAKAIKRAKQVQYTTKRRQKVKAEAVEYKGGKCSVCGYCRCIASLEFHHRNKNEKEFTMSRTNKSLAQIKSELDKCDLVCANCHREIHEALNESNQR